MVREIKYKQQGDGRDSWEIREIEGEVLVNAYMVYQNPENLSTPLSDHELISSFHRLKELGVI